LEILQYSRCSWKVEQNWGISPLRSARSDMAAPPPFLPISTFLKQQVIREMMSCLGLMQQVWRGLAVSFPQGGAVQPLRLLYLYLYIELWFTSLLHKNVPLHFPFFSPSSPTTLYACDASDLFTTLKICCSGRRYSGVPPSTWGVFFWRVVAYYKCVSAHCPAHCTVSSSDCTRAVFNGVFLVFNSHQSLRPDFGRQRL